MPGGARVLELRQCEFANGGFRLSANWSLAPGDHLAVIGPSGAGKSTLLSGIGGFIELEKGAVLWNGVSSPQNPAHRPVATLFQSHNLFGHLTVQQNIKLGISPTLSISHSEGQRISAALQDVDLPGMEQRKPGELSGGQQSRVALARILVMARPVVLMDEPFSALGPAQRADMLALVRQVCTRLNAVLIIVTHDPGEAQALGGLVSFVEAGIAQTPQQSDAFFANPPQGLRSYLGNS